MTRPHWRRKHPPTLHGQAVLDALTSSAAVLDQEGTICAVNGAWRRVAEHGDGDLLGESYLRACDSAAGPSAENAHAAASGLRALLAKRGEHFSLEYPCQIGPDLRWYTMHASRFAEDGELLVLVTHDDTTERFNAQRSARVAAQKLSAVREEERRHVANELHDGVGQRMVALNMVLERLSRDVPQATPSVQEALRMSREMIGEVRGLSERLYPRSLQLLGLVPALEHVVRELQSQPVPALAFRATPGLRTMRFDPRVEINLFRIAQEALTNAVRHSGASLVELQLLLHETELELTVIDDGAGFETESSDRRGIGLMTMAERATSIRSTLEMQSAPGRTSIQARVSLASALPVAE